MRDLKSQRDVRVNFVLWKQHTYTLLPQGRKDSRIRLHTLCPLLKANLVLKINRSSNQKTNGTLWSKRSDFSSMQNFTLKFQSIWRQWFFEKKFLEFTNLWFKNQGLRFCMSPWKSFKNTHTWAFEGENDFSKFQVLIFCPLQWNFQKNLKNFQNGRKNSNCTGN